MQKNTYKKRRGDTTGTVKSGVIHSDASDRQNSDAASPVSVAEADHSPVIHVVIPVFNRIEETLSCIECLKTQTYEHIKIIVTDGGSTDGTPQKLRQCHPDVVVLESNKPLWWGGSTRMGIAWALKNSSSDQDFVMMLNNDTLFQPDLISTLVQHSIKNNAAVCAIVVDADDPKHVIDAGVTLDWSRYAFVGLYQRPKNKIIKLDSDVLPGRGTVIPINAIRKAGNVDDRRFPHYLSDYEFTYRLKKIGGIRLAVAYDTEVRTKVDANLPAEPDMAPLREMISRIKNRLSRRSKQNMIDHLNFVRIHAPLEYKNRHTLRLLKQNIQYFIQPMGHWVKNSLVLGFPIRVLQKIANVARQSWRMVFGPYLINTDDTRQLELDFLRLNQHKIIEPSGYSGYFVPGRNRRYIKENYPEALALYRRAASPGRKIYRFLDSHSRIPARPDIHAKWPGGLVRFGQRLRRVFGPYLLIADDCYRFDLGLNKLLEQGIIAPSPYLDYYYMTQAGQLAARDSTKIGQLQNHAGRMDLKIKRFFKTRGQRQAHRLAMRRTI